VKLSDEAILQSVPTLRPFCYTVQHVACNDNFFPAELLSTVHYNYT